MNWRLIILPLPMGLPSVLRTRLVLKDLCSTATTHTLFLESTNMGIEKGQRGDTHHLLSFSQKSGSTEIMLKSCSIKTFTISSISIVEFNFLYSWKAKDFSSSTVLKFEHYDGYWRNCGGFIEHNFGMISAEHDFSDFCAKLKRWCVSPCCPCSVLHSSIPAVLVISKCILLSAESGSHPAFFKNNKKYISLLQTCSSDTSTALIYLISNWNYPHFWKKNISLFCTFHTCICFSKVERYKK